MAVVESGLAVGVRAGRVAVATAAMLLEVAHPAGRSIALEHPSIAEEHVDSGVGEQCHCAGGFGQIVLPADDEAASHGPVHGREGRRAVQRSLECGERFVGRSLSAVGSEQLPEGGTQLDQVPPVSLTESFRSFEDRWIERGEPSPSELEVAEEVDGPCIVDVERVAELHDDGLAQQRVLGRRHVTNGR